MDKRTIDISTGIVFRTIMILVALWFLYFIRDILALVFIAIIIVAAIDPLVDWLQKKKISRGVGVLLIYFLIFMVIALSVALVIPPLAGQLKDFSQKIPFYATGIENFIKGIADFFRAQHIQIDTQKVFEDLSKGFSSLSQGIFSTTVGIFSGFASAIMVMVMAFYMSVKEDGIRQFIVSVTPDRHKEYAASLTVRIKEKMGKWMLGQVFLMFIIFILDFVGLLLLGVPYALSLAILAGILEIVPYIGPIVSAIPAVIVGFLISPLTGLMVLGLFVLVQQFESHIIIPQVMKKTVGLNPIAVILALLVGAKLGGILGIILSVPIVTAASVFVGDLFEKPKEI